MQRSLAAAMLAVLLSGCFTTVTTTSSSAHTVPFGSGPEREAIQFDTDAGPLTILLYPEAAPKTVALMETYVKEGYYVQRSFGRTVPGHVIQVADAAGGATDDARRVPLEVNATFHFAAGAVGTARDVDPNSGGPELFIMDYATSHLDGNYTVWGQVLSDLAVVHDIATRPALDSSTLPAVPNAPVGAPFDRMPLVPVRITAARLIPMRMASAALAHYPLQVAKDVRAGDLRHSLEWPADLHAGALSTLTWYIRPYGNTQVPQGDLAIRDGNATLRFSAVQSGIYSFQWTPTSGPHTLSFFAGSQRLADLRVEVPPAGALVLN